MKAIVSVFARDAKGITAYITAALAEQNINILDISQTLMQGYFTMIMLVDLAECEMPFDMLSQHLRSVGEARACGARAAAGYFRRHAPDLRRAP